MGTSAPPAEPRSKDKVELRRVVEEQAALRRVATLVAEGAEPAEVFTAVAEEIARLIGADGAALTRCEPDGTVTALGGWTLDGGYRHVGTRYPLEGSLTSRVLQSRRPARIDSYANAPGPAAEAAREMGWHSSVGAPIVVGRRPWGILAVVSKSEKPLPAETEPRLASFTELVATAIANAESRNELKLLADEQAALRRVATLVAEGSKPNEAFAAIAAEVAGLFGVPIAVMVRYDGDGMATVLATVGTGFSPVGSRFPVEAPTLTEAVFRTGKAVRNDDWASVPDPAAALAYENGIRWAVGVPIVVDGALWGVIAVAAPETVSASQVQPRLVTFTELLATAIANTQAHEQLAELADEQAALRRVATLVAEGAPAPIVFDAVRHEVARMFNSPLSALMRYDAPGTMTVLASGEGFHGPIVGTWPVEGDDSALAQVCRTGRPARADYTRPVRGALAQVARREGTRSSVAVPIMVDGALWGVISLGSREIEPLPANAEHHLAKFTELLATAIANAEGRAELEASRARIVATADATRRRIERDLHDGAQQQLVSLALAVRAAQAGVPEEFDEHRSELGRVVDGLASVLDDLRETALGIHPAGLSEDGLTPALKRLVARSPLRVNLDVRADGRFPESVEVAAYYVVSESLTNAAKYAEIPVVDVAVAADRSALRVEVRDEGRGGADPADGSGLVGLRDRVEAIGGTMHLNSPQGAGTSLLVELPLPDRAARAH